MQYLTRSIEFRCVGTRHGASKGNQFATVINATVDARVNGPGKLVFDVCNFTALTEQVGVPGSSVKALVML